MTLPLLLCLEWKNEFLVLIKHCLLMGNDTDVYMLWQTCPVLHIQRSSTGLLICLTISTNDALSSGRSQEAVTPENITKIREDFLSDREMKFKRWSIIHEFYKWKCLAPRSLNTDQKDKLAWLSKDSLAQIKSNKNEMLRRFVTMDKIWIHHWLSM